MTTDDSRRAKLAENLKKARAALALKRAAQPLDKSQLVRPATPPLSRDRVAARRFLEHEMKRALERVASIRTLLSDLDDS